VTLLALGAVTAWQCAHQRVAKRWQLDDTCLEDSVHEVPLLNCIRCMRCMSLPDSLLVHE
jgi:polyferredoxin